MGFFKDILGLNNNRYDNSEFDKALDDWINNYQKDGYHVSDDIKKLMRESLDSQLHPENYPPTFWTESVMKIEAQVKKENGEESPLEGMTHDGMIKELQAANREIYYKEDVMEGNHDVLPPEGLYKIEKEQDEIIAEIYAPAGGKDNVSKMIAWGDINLTQEQMMNYHRPFNELITEWGPQMNFKSGDTLRDHTSIESIQKCKDAALYLQALYKKGNA
jgi:hypothetical protein